MKKNVSEKQFFDLCESYAKQKDALDIENFVNKHVMTCEIVTRLISFEFIYYKKSVFPAKKRSLTCRVYLKKNSFIYFLLPDLIPHFSDNDFRSTFFENVTEEKFKACMSQLFEILDEYLPKFEEAYEDYQDIKAYDDLFRDYKKFYKLKENEIDFSKLEDADSEDCLKFINMQAGREYFMIYKYTQSPEYGHFILGNTDEAIAAYEKIGKKGELYEYDKKLLAFLKTPAAKGYQPLPRACMSVGEGSGYGVVSSQREAKDMLRNTAICYVPLAILFCATMAIIQYTLTAGSLVDIGPVWLFGLVCALLSAIFIGIAHRRLITKLLDKEKAQQHLMMDEMINSPKMNVFINIACTVFFALSLIGVLGFSSTCPAVYEDRVEYSYIPFVYEDYYYKDVDEVYYINARYNDYDERIDIPSYVFIMKDGSSFDFYATSIEVDDVEKTILPILEEYNLKPIVVDSDRDLPIEI